MKIVHWKMAHFERLVPPNLITGTIRRTDALVDEIRPVAADVIVSDRLTQNEKPF
jgi:hypothetical protein